MVVVMKMRIGMRMRDDGRRGWELKLAFGFGV